MKFSFFLFLLSVSLFAQAGEYLARAEAMYLYPLGTLHQRFTGTVGVTAAFGKQTSPNTVWLGRVEYYKFNKLNTDELYFKRIRTINKREYEFKEPLKHIDMHLESAGASAELQYSLFSTFSFSLKLIGGFGVYYWQSLRGPYKDSVKVRVPNGNVTGTQDTVILLETFNIQGSQQFDWSGGAYSGLEAEYQIYESLWINASAQYKAVIGEIWQTLKIDLENVAVMQMAVIKAGVTLKL
jgi:hypothetical protein